MNCFEWKISLIVFSCMVLFVLQISLARGQSEHTAKLIEGAKKEGKLVWYTAMSLSESRPLLDAFEKKYPFVKGELFRAGGDRTVNRIMTESRAGRWEFDVVSASGVNILVQQRLISPYVSPETNFFNQRFKDPAGHWTAIYINYLVIGYNTDLVSESEAPKDWGDLLNASWKGKMAIDREEYPWYAALVSAWGKERTQQYMKALAMQQIQWREGHTLIAQLMSAGEFPVAIVYAHRIEDMKKKGAPVEWVDTLDPVVVPVYGMGISKKPNNQNSAKLFVDFVLSKEGQQMIRSFDRIPPRADVEPLLPRLGPSKLKLEVVPQDMAVRYNDYIEEFRNIFGH